MELLYAVHSGSLDASEPEVIKLHDQVSSPCRDQSKDKSNSSNRSSQYFQQHFKIKTPLLSTSW